MKKMGLNEVREAYLKFFEEKDHLRLQSFPLIPKNDKSLLLINAGMAPLKPYFTGLQTPPNTRITTCQKCIRTGDIDNVGKTSRHATFFEMLGNFSFGDYFKEEIIPWAWEFVTKTLDIPKDKLFVTIYLEDDEAYDIWTKKTDIDEKCIFRLGKKDNFWEHGAGPCGPCTEIHYNKASVVINNADEFMKASDEDKVVEFWNLVFTQFDGDGHGNYEKLKNPNIDTGMGLERMATVMQGVDSIFEVDTIKSILEKVCETFNVKYGSDKLKDISLRIITDHVRSTSFMICDGILPSNEGRGYVLRRLLRRALRHGRLLGLNKPFLYTLCDTVIENSKDAYGEIYTKAEYIKKVIKIEEERFEETIDLGIQILNDYVKEMVENNEKIMSGEKVFKLYDTYGFPLELTEEILEEKGLNLNMESFNAEMKSQRERARAARAESNYMGSEDTVLNKIDKELETSFDGYNKLELVSDIKLLVREDEFVSTLIEGDEGVIITSVTPFYAEMGGQVGDTGFIENNSFKAEVLDCRKNVAGKIIHIVKVLEGSINLLDTVSLKVLESRRNAIRKNHTATHMLQVALKDVLGDHVHQSGSYVDGERLRFDFSHFTALTEEEIKNVEEIINLNIMKVLTVDTKVMSIDEAKATGAIALFDDKYKENVRVVSIGDYSKELCGGTHAFNGGEIGIFKIVSEYGVAAGVRRIEGVTGFNALKFIEEKSSLLKDASNSLKCSEKEIKAKIQNLTSEMKEKDKEISELKLKIASGFETEILNSLKEVKGVKLLVGALSDIDSDSLRDLAEKVRSKCGDCVIVLGSKIDNKVQFVAMASKEAIKKGVHCGMIIKEIANIAGGGGGGRPDMAQAGGKLPEKLEEAINAVEKVMGNLVR